MKTTQIKTVMVSVESVITSHHFILGWNDKRLNRFYHKDYDTWTINNQFQYERGRQFSILTQNKVMPVIKGTKKANSEAVHICNELIKNKSII